MNLSYLDILTALGFILICLGVSYKMRLGLGKTLVIATARTLIQLNLIGLILAWIFAQSQWYQVLAILSVMTIIASVSASGRVSKPYAKLKQDVFVSLVCGAGLVSFLAIQWVLKISPWYTPQYIIPVLGLVLGNALTGVSLTSSELIKGLHNNQASINAKLALSASPTEAVQDLVKSSIINGLTPTINAMMVVGLVSLPGMMTGQILAGADPTQAVRYQIVTMLFICTGSMLSCTLSAYLILRRFFNEDWQLVVPK